MRRLHILAASVAFTLALAGVVWAAASAESVPTAPAEPSAVASAAPAAAPEAAEAPQPAEAAACCAAAEGEAACPPARAPQAFAFVAAPQAEALSQLIEELKASGDLSAAGAEKLTAALENLQASRAVMLERMPPAPDTEARPGVRMFKWRSGEAPEAGALGEWQTQGLLLQREGPMAFSTEKLSAEQLMELEGKLSKLSGELGGMKWEGKMVAPRAFSFSGTNLSDEQKAAIEKEVAEALKGLDLERLSGDVLKEIGQGLSGLDAQEQAQIEREVTGALQGLDLRSLELEGLAQSLPRLSLKADELAQLESELSRLVEETLPQLEERLQKLEEELAQERESEAQQELESTNS